MSQEAIEKRITIENPAHVDHDPLKDIKQQQEVLDKAIHQHEGDADIVDALKKQKAELGEMAKDYRSQNEQLKEHPDGGGAFLSSLHHSGNLGDVLSSGDGKTRVFTRTVNKFEDDDGKSDA